MRKRTYLLPTLAVLLLTAAAYAHWPMRGLPTDAVADAVLVEKSAR